MQVRQVMEKELITAQTSANLQEIARKMKNHNVGSVIIVDEAWKLRGILTYRMWRSPSARTAAILPTPAPAR